MKQSEQIELLKNDLKDCSRLLSNANVEIVSLRKQLTIYEKLTINASGIIAIEKMTEALAQVITTLGGKR